ncbi:hypothetical protein ABBQ32_008412 [Trebouxia sp. C0010 RCD-2024]
MRLLVACCRQGNLTLQGNKQHVFTCRMAKFRGWTVSSPSRGSQASSVAHLAASSDNFAEFSRQHFSSDVGSAAGRSKAEEREYEAAKNSAAGSLSLRPHSRKELEIKLEDKGYSADAISRALDRLAELKVQSDADYAEVYTRSKWRRSRWAPSRIHQELLKKGVSKHDCQLALEGVFGESSRGRVRFNLDDLSEDDAGMPTLFGTEGRIDQQLLASARRQAELTEGLPSETRKRRLTGWLLRRGHEWDTVSKIAALLKL